MKERDWTHIKTEYISTDMSVRALAGKYGVSYRRLTDLCSKEGWVAGRKEYRDRIAAEALRKASRARAEDLAAYTLRMHSAADKLEGVIDALLGRLTDEGLEEIAQGRNPGREIESLSKALDNLDNLKRKLYGAMAPRDELRLKLDREKLELDRRRYEQSQQEDKEIVVRFEGADAGDYCK